MTRKDLIIISVLVNMGLLAILYITAMHTEEPEASITDSPATYTQAPPPSPIPTPIPTPQIVEEPLQHIEPIQALPVDEVDQSIREYFPETPLPAEITEDESQPSPEMSTDHENVPGKMIEITVKQGDSLDKIARANGTSISAIKSANNLTTDKLKIGQKLKVMVNSNTKAPIAAVTPQPTSSQDPEYYTVKSGDNPWKIAKQFHVKFEDLLKMNNLDEEEARNLKVGDRLRVK